MSTDYRSKSPAKTQEILPDKGFVIVPPSSSTGRARIDVEKSGLVVIRAIDADADERLHVLAGGRYDANQERAVSPDLDAEWWPDFGQIWSDYVFRGKPWPVFDTLYGRSMLAEGIEVISEAGFIDCPNNDDMPCYDDLKPVPKSLVEAARAAVQEKREARAEIEKYVLRNKDIKTEAGRHRNYVIKGVLSEGDIGAIIGHPGVGKSLIGPYIAHRVANGERIFGLRTRKCKTLYVAAEDPAGLADRADALKRVYGDAPDFMMTKDITALADPEGDDFKRLLDIVRIERPGLVVIDTKAAAFSGVGEDEIGTAVALDAAKALIKNGAGAVVFIHHDTKAGGDSGRGHGSLDGALDVRLYLTKDEASGVTSGILGKNRNGVSGPGGWRPAFRIGVAELGIDDEGDPITAAYADDVTEKVARKHAEEDADDERLFLDLLDIHTAESKSVFPKKGPGYAPAMFAAHVAACGTPSPKFEAAMERLLEKGVIEIGKKGRSNPIVRSEVFAAAAA
ncbi:AAA family ATPase [Mesorhizobium sp. B2-4-1]|uniref:AAA family ATPase n=1 Tax=Mesorhizobium sp. B2-4-1 TaxID=2589948 RepID=UPI00112ED02B|nr:AAA family ATPase [Mesorhizobium sp. B2-4-1]TPL64671.1 AAA family ATPase [Mesorhizobium sp. B2-4-1]